MRRAWLFVAAAAVMSGCLIPRSAGFGQTGAALAPGAAEVGLSAGGIYHSFTTLQSSAAGDSALTNTTAIGLPALEGNVQYGLTDRMGLNVHLGPAGLQPGLKLAVLRGPVAIALLPAVAIGYYTTSTRSIFESGGIRTEAITQMQNNLIALAGLKLIVSHSSGAYLGLGYDFQYMVMSSPSKSGSGLSTSTIRSHNLGIAGGGEFQIGLLRIRPEIAIQYSPSLVSTAPDGSSPGSSSSTLLYVYPNVTVAISPPPR